MERQHVMLAGREKLEIPKQHHFVVLLGLKLRHEHVFGSLRIATIDFLSRPDDSVGSLSESFTVRIVSDASQN
ncbi:MAG TPA: hypothetical protein VE086_04865, partial [Chthoniobacterales bacterium]|nr:hypothetical protein [Chthoniobacterales bacterium]